VVRATQPLPESAAECDDGQWTHGGATETQTFYQSFSVRPPSGWDGREAVKVALFAAVEADATRPAVRFRRVLQFPFATATATRVPVFLRVQCGAASVGCSAVGGGPCTVAAICEERGQTCGDEGTCASVEVTPTPVAPDAATVGLPTRDAAVRDADASVAMGPVRAVRPLPNERVATASPTFSYANAEGRSVVIDVCRDRACSMVVASSPTLTVGAPWTSAGLTNGRYFWRATPMSGAMPDLANGSATRAFTVRVGQCPSPPEFDSNGDGLADMAAGAPAATIGASAQTGYAALFAGRPPAPSSTPTQREEGPTFDTRGRFGEAMVGLDYNLDGVSDWVITNPGFNNGNGSWSLRPGSVAGGAPARGGNVGIALAPANSRPGIVAASLGDIDNDGFVEMAASSESGPVFVFDFAGNTIRHRATVTEAAMGFGAAIAGHCDFDGDGRDDMAIGAPGSDAVFIYLGANATSASWTSSARLTAPTVGTSFGAAVACGHLDGDGLTDLVIGAPRSSLDRGAAHRYSTQPGGRTFNLRTSRDGITAGDSFGSAVFAARDLDGDGRCDVLVSARGADAGALVDNGSVTLLRSTMDGTRTLSSVVGGSAAGEQLGGALSSIGDLNGDGLPDVVVGAAFASIPAVNAGRVAAFTITATGTFGPVLLSVRGAAAGEELGASLLR
jgi:hypothetical protein